MLVAINPTTNDAGESLCSLQFASRVRGIELGAASRNVTNTSDVRQLQTQLGTVQAKCSTLQSRNDFLSEQVFQLQEHIANEQVLPPLRR